MRATAIEFRLRMAINVVIIILGFWSPWIEAWHIGKRISLIEWLALQLSRFGIASFSLVTSSLLALALLFALVSVILRISGTAWLGPNTVNSINLVAGRVMADGPYRFLRNPLYIGLWCMVVAMAFLMPATGALFAIALVTLFIGSPHARRGIIPDPTHRRILHSLSPCCSPIHSAASRCARRHWLKTALASRFARGTHADRRFCRHCRLRAQL